MTNQPNNEWVDRFEKQFTNRGTIIWVEGKICLSLDPIKSFIQSEKDKSFKEGQESVTERLKSRLSSKRDEYKEFGTQSLEGEIWGLESLYKELLSELN